VVGDIENKTVVTALLAELVDRGLNTDGGLLVVIDGAKPSPPRCVKRWRDGKMIQHWCAAGMLNAHRSLRRRKGDRQMPRFVAALARHVEAVPPAWDAAPAA
jgi:hypothetical protein